MSDQIKTELMLLISANTAKIDADITKLKGKLEGLERSGKGSGKGITDGLGSALPDMTKFGLAAGAGALAINEISKAFDQMLARETELADFSAITGLTGKALDEVSRSATEMSNKFGTSVVENITALKGVISRLGPSFAQSSEAMNIMTENINIMSKASGLDATQSMEVLTTAMLQFGVDLSDPVKAAKEATVMLNILSSGAKEGAAELPQLGESLVQVGSTAKSLNVPFTETAAALEVLATKGKYGSEAGIGLRNSLVALAKPSKEAEDALNKLGYSSKQFNETLTSKGISAAYKELNGFVEKNGTLSEQATLKVQLFGKENLSAASALLDGADAIKEFNDKMSGTNTAFDQANIKMATTTERWKRFTGSVTNYLEIGVADTQKKILDWGDAVGNFFSGNWKEVLKYQYGLREETKFTADEVKKQFKEMYDKNVVSNGLAGVINAVKEGNARLKKEAEDQAIKDADEREKQDKINKENADKAKKERDKSLKELAEYNKARIVNIKDTSERLFENYREQVRLESVSDDSARVKREKNLESLNRYKADLAKLSDELTDIQSKPAYEPKKNSIFEPAEFKRTIDDNIDILQYWKQESANELNEMMKRMDVYANKTQMITSIFSSSFAGIGNAIGSAIQGQDISFKDSLKGVLVSMLDFVEAEFVLAEAAAAIRLFATWGLSALSDTWGWLAAFAGLEIAKAAVGSFAVGSWNIPNDQMAMVHKNEMIIPAPMAESVRKGDAVVSSGSNSSTTKRRKQPASLKGSIDININSFDSGNRYSKFQYETGIA